MCSNASSETQVIMTFPRAIGFHVCKYRFYMNLMSNVGYSKYNLDLVYTVLILLLNQGMYEYKVHRNP